MNLTETILSRKKIYEGHMFTFEQWQVTLPDGKEAGRDVLLHPGATAVIALDSENRVAMVRQFRAPVQEALLEIPAGKLSPDEDPLVCAKRELLEETGITAGKWTYLTALYPAPAYCTEVLHLYLAENLSFGEQNLDEDEFLESTFLPLTQLLDQVMSEQIHDPKTCVAAFWISRIKGI